MKYFKICINLNQMIRNELHFTTIGHGLIYHRLNFHTNENKRSKYATYHWSYFSYKVKSLKMDSNLPIDIQLKKMSDWLISRRICNKSWHDNVSETREKIAAAIIGAYYVCISWNIFTNLSEIDCKWIYWSVMLKIVLFSKAMYKDWT